MVGPQEQQEEDEETDKVRKWGPVVGVAFNPLPGRSPSQHRLSLLSRDSAEAWTEVRHSSSLSALWAARKLGELSLLTSWSLIYSQPVSGAKAS